MQFPGVHYLKKALSERGVVNITVAMEKVQVRFIPNRVKTPRKKQTVVTQFPQFKLAGIITTFFFSEDGSGVDGC